jgi:hypothetical protein
VQTPARWKRAGPDGRGHVDRRILSRVIDPSKKASKTEARAVVAGLYLLVGVLYLIGGTQRVGWLGNHWAFGVIWLLGALIWAVRAWRAGRDQKRSMTT